MEPGGADKNWWGLKLIKLTLLKREYKNKYKSDYLQKKIPRNYKIEKADKLYKQASKSSQGILLINCPTHLENNFFL